MPNDDFWLQPGQTLTPFGGPVPPLQGDRFTRLATEEVDRERLRGLLDRGLSRSARATAAYGLRLDATRLAHQARSWTELVTLIRRQLHSHALDRADEAKLFIDTAASSYGLEHGDVDSAALYAQALERELTEAQQTAWQKERQKQIYTRAAQMRKDPILHERFEWQDRVQKLADETGVDYAYAEAFILEYERLSRPSFPGVIDPHGIPFIQLEKPLAQMAWAIKNFTPAGASFLLYEAYKDEDLLTGERLAWWERALNVVTVLPAFIPEAALKAGVRAVARGAKVISEAVQSGGKALAAIAVRIGRGMKPALRMAVKLRRLPAAEVQALLQRVRAARAASTALKLTAREATLMREVNSAFKELNVVEAGARSGSRTASGVIEDGRSISKAQSGVIDSERAAKPVAASSATAGALSKAARALVAEGYLPEALESLERLGVKLTAKSAASLKAMGNTGRDFVNLFYRSKGFQRVVRDLLKGGQREEGAKFVMRFATQHPDILIKVRANPLNVAFEWGAGIKKTRRFGDIFARDVDIVVRGDAALGEGSTVYNELKSWTEKTLKAAKGKNLPQQFVRDTALLNPHNIRWVFDGAKIGDPAKVIDVFIELIQGDAYLSKAWGTDRAALEAALKRVVVIF